ncbi:Nitroreductase [Verrucomicrobium sp. GAS474]|uniref:nitroreductase family protein n=1 Tax=Verrucomicrobium sp. GAS474 TaxID=1882831 RepID=UPI00087C134E|nr:nitroreductase [Verrucomicrobium sp. GAS474]SDT89916.1 Nitroreductase [Verrucomicrobium sp. GAS474]
MTPASPPYRTRRTVKPPQMDPSREVSEALLREILEDAHWAPTHGLTQPWRFHVFAGAARARLAEGLVSIHDRIVPESPAKAEKREKMRGAALTAPVAVAVLAYVEPEATRKISEREEIEAAACAVQNLMLSAHGHGLGSFWATPPAACAPEFAAWLGLDAHHLPLGMVYLGYPKPGIAATSARVPLDERVTFHR